MWSVDAAYNTVHFLSLMQQSVLVTTGHASLALCCLSQGILSSMDNFVIAGIMIYLVEGITVDQLARNSMKSFGKWHVCNRYHEKKAVSLVSNPSSLQAIASLR